MLIVKYLLGPLCDCKYAAYCSLFGKALKKRLHCCCKAVGPHDVDFVAHISPFHQPDAIEQSFQARAVAQADNPSHVRASEDDQRLTGHSGEPVFRPVAGLAFQNFGQNPSVQELDQVFRVVFCLGIALARLGRKAVTPKIESHDPKL